MNSLDLSIDNSLPITLNQEVPTYNLFFNILNNYWWTLLVLIVICLFYSKKNKKYENYDFDDD